MHFGGKSRIIAIQRKINKTGQENDLQNNKLQKWDWNMRTFLTEGENSERIYEYKKNKGNNWSRITQYRFLTIGYTRCIR